MWYCMKKGYKLWFELKFEDVKFMFDGGYMIWYDEFKFLKDIEKCIGVIVMLLGLNYVLLEVFGMYGGKDVYGKVCDEKLNEELNVYLEAYVLNVCALAVLETKV